MLFCLFWQAVNQKQLAKHRVGPKIEKLETCCSSYEHTQWQKRDLFSANGKSSPDVGL
jgi:hypothetical protein